MATEKMLKDVLSLLASAGVDVLIFKGTALGYLLYDEPWHRARNDTDLLVRETDLPKVESLLSDEGFEAGFSLPGMVAFGELAFSNEGNVALSHTLDVHWRLNNAWVLAGVFNFDALWREKITVPALGSNAFTVAFHHALIVSCIHRVAHRRYVAYEVNGFERRESDFTLWVYDIHLLAGELDDAGWQSLVDIAIRNKMARIVLQGLERSKSLFSSLVPAKVLAQLNVAEHQLTIGDFSTMVGSELQNIKAIPGVGRKLTYLREHIFPGPGYMKARYGPGRNIVTCYCLRIVEGMKKAVGAG
jgi:hypothetical protein